METEFTLKCGYLKDVLRDTPDNTFDSVVSDPPYGLEFMGMGWDKVGDVVESPSSVGGFQDGNGGNQFSRARIRYGNDGRGFQAMMTDNWETIVRTMKPGAGTAVFGGTQMYHRMACAMEDAGLEIFDTIAWCYGSGSPKNMDLSEEAPGHGTRIKPAWEPIILARKPHEKGLTIVQNIRKWGVGGLNIDESRSAECDWRWPANFIVDEEAQLDLPVHARRFFYCPKASSDDREEGLDTSFPIEEVRGGGGRVTEGYANLSEGKGKAAGQYGAAKAAKRNIHPTVKPTALMRWLVTLVTPSGGLVLDPFMGSGSTGKACLIDKFRFFGIDKDPRYVKIAQARIEHARLCRRFMHHVYKV